MAASFRCIIENVPTWSWLHVCCCVSKQIGRMSVHIICLTFFTKKLVARILMNLVVGVTFLFPWFSFARHWRFSFQLDGKWESTDKPFTRYVSHVHESLLVSSAMEEYFLKMKLFGRLTCIGSKRSCRSSQDVCSNLLINSRPEPAP
jgi:hypothetical protein